MADVMGLLYGQGRSAGMIPFWEYPAAKRKVEQQEAALAQRQQEIQGLLGSIGQQQQGAQTLIGPGGELSSPVPGLMGATQAPQQYGTGMARDLMQQMQPGSAMWQDQMDFIQAESVRRQEAAQARAAGPVPMTLAQQSTAQQGQARLEEQMRHNRDLEAQALADDAYAANTMMNKDVQSFQLIENMAVPLFEKAQAGGVASLNGADTYQLMNAFQKTILPPEAVMSDNLKSIEAAGGALGMSEGWLAKAFGRDTLGDTDTRILLNAVQRNLGQARVTVERLIENQQRYFKDRDMYQYFNPLQLNDLSAYKPFGEAPPAGIEGPDTGRYTYSE